jgi:hypothetical protein
LPIQTKQNSTGLNGALAFFALVARQKNDAIAKALTRAQISRDATILARPQTRDVAANNPRAAFGPVARIHDETSRGMGRACKPRMKASKRWGKPESFAGVGGLRRRNRVDPLLAHPVKFNQRIFVILCQIQSATSNFAKHAQGDAV